MQQQNDNGSYDPDRVEKIKKELEVLGNPDFTVTPLDFEKDDDNNLHMDFIVAASNLRASNYKIAPADKYKVGLSVDDLQGRRNECAAGNVPETRSVRIIFNEFSFLVEIDCWQNHPRNRNHNLARLRMRRLGIVQAGSRVSQTNVAIEAFS